MDEQTMCHGGACPRKYGCMRFIGEAGGRQAYFERPPFKDAESCEYFVDARACLACGLTPHEIARRAFEIFKEDRTYHDYAWFLAEALLVIEQVVRGDPAVIAPDAMLADPGTWTFNKRAVSQDDVRIAARAVAGKHAPVQDLHWSLAEASLLLRALEDRFRVVIPRERRGAT
ncbi:MAG: hypothetical protein JW839_03585 [Candidatus Lokiarchaeota archaeon]|nr:hypothetical protein [Candidatus Lokiarchaeota archaeon]